MLVQFGPLEALIVFALAIIGAYAICAWFATRAYGRPGQGPGEEQP